MGLIDSDRVRLGARFGEDSGEYERLRPSYPSGVVEWCLGREPLTVADVGAGTGKLTEVLARLGHTVRAVEPSEGMVARLRDKLPQVAVFSGTAEETGLPSAAVDAVLFAQSWAWVDARRACREAARILRPGGALCILWNVMDPAADWTCRFREQMHVGDGASLLRGAPADPRRGGSDDVEVCSPFAVEDRFETTWMMPLTKRDVPRLVTTRSYYLDLAADERARLLGRLEEFVDGEFPDRADGDPVNVPYVTYAVRARVIGT